MLLTLLVLSVPAGASAATFSNNTGITINDGFCGGNIQATATPYPSTIAAFGLPGHVITDVNVTLTGFTHTFPSEVRALLVGPQGQTVLLLHENGDETVADDIDLTFDDEAASHPPTDGSALTAGTYKPSDQSENPIECAAFTAATPLPAPAPQTTPYGSALSGFDGTDPNGDWHLYVVDIGSTDIGNIDAWSVTIETTPPSCRGRTPTIIGTPGPDTIRGTAGPDVISGLGGADKINGLGGHDVVCGDEGDDTVNGENGNDELDGGAGLDTIRSGEDAGADKLYGGPDADTLIAVRGNDVLEGGLGDDVLRGGLNNDTLRGDDGADKLFGYYGNDNLAGGAGAPDQCDGGHGFDTLAPSHGCETTSGI